MSWLDDLDAELRRARIPGSRRQRILAEVADHLACDPEARLGEPRKIALRFANELGTVFARRAALTTFFAFVPFGLLFGAVFALAAVYTTNVATGLTLALVLGVQLAFVGGTLALVRGWRLRRAAVITRSEARVLLRRAGLGLAGGALTVAALAAIASGRWLGVQWSMPPLAWATVGVGTAAVLIGVAALVRAWRFLPLGDGAAGDLSLDLGLDADPWRLALAIAGTLTLCIAVGGLVQGDPIDGLVRAVGDGVLCLAGFALLGRPLGLRR